MIIGVGIMNTNEVSQREKVRKIFLFSLLAFVFFTILASASSDYQVLMSGLRSITVSVILTSPTFRILQSFQNYTFPVDTKA
jgi:hypothetical protein